MRTCNKLIQFTHCMKGHEGEEVAAGHLTNLLTWCLREPWSG